MVRSTAVASCAVFGLVLWNVIPDVVYNLQARNTTSGGGPSPPKLRQRAWRAKMLERYRISTTTYPAAIGGWISKARPTSMIARMRSRAWRKWAST